MDNKLSQLIVDMLRRKKEDAVMNQGGQVVPAARKPTPEMLGSGGAQRAAVALLRGQQAPMEYVDNLK